MIIEIYSFLIFNTVLVLGINVPDDTHNDSDICMDKTLLNSCTKTCGESRCDMDSFCGEDGRCLYCSDAICKSMPIKYGCDISCAIRFTGMFEVWLQCQFSVFLLLLSSFIEFCRLYPRHDIVIKTPIFVSFWKKKYVVNNQTCHVYSYEWFDDFFSGCVKNLKYLFQTRFIIAMPKKKTDKKWCLSMVRFYWRKKEFWMKNKTTTTSHLLPITTMLYFNCHIFFLL